MLTLIAAKLPVTIQLAVMAIFFAFLIGIPMGILAAVKKNTPLDYLASFVALSAGVVAATAGAGAATGASER